MPARLQRKLIDCTTGEQLAEVQELLKAKRIGTCFQIWSKPEMDVFRVYVYVMHLEAAKKVLEERKHGR